MLVDALIVIVVIGIVFYLGPIIVACLIYAVLGLFAIVCAVIAVVYSAFWETVDAFRKANAKDRIYRERKTAYEALLAAVKRHPRSVK